MPGLARLHNAWGSSWKNWYCYSYQIYDIIVIIFHMLSGRKKDVVGILVWWECGNKRNSKSEKKWERRRKGSSTDAKVFQFSALKHEPTPQLGCPGKLLNKTFIIENTVACVLSRTCKLSYSPVFLLHFCSRKNPITTLRVVNYASDIISLFMEIFACDQVAQCTGWPTPWKFHILALTRYFQSL